MVRNITKLRKIILPLILMAMIISVLGYIHPDTSSTSNSTNATNESDPIAIANISTNYADWSDEYDDSWLNSSGGKVNKTGDSMTGVLNMSDNKITNVSDIESKNRDMVFWQNKTGSQMQFRCTSPAFSSCIRFISERGLANIVNFMGLSSTGSGASMGIQFSLRGAKGTYENMTPHNKGDYAGQLVFQGAAATNTWAVAGSIWGEAAQTWNATQTGGDIVFGTVPNGTISSFSTERMRLREDGNLTVNSLAGSGNAPVTADTNGKLQRNTLNGTGNVYLCYNFTSNSIYAGNPTC